MGLTYRDKIVKAFRLQISLVSKFELEPEKRIEKEQDIYKRFQNILTSMLYEGIITWNAYNKIDADLKSVMYKGGE